jgi:alpha-galactosidase/6-phospho-beta-glucosidase family protein
MTTPEDKKEYMRKWQQDHREEQNERRRKYYQEHRDEALEMSKKYRKEHPDKCKESDRNKYQKYKEKYKEMHRNYQKKHAEETKMKRRTLRIKALGTIAEFHNTKVECWRCHESRIWVLTIGHINQDGKNDKIKYGNSGIPFLKAILSGERVPGDLKIECMNCNSCLEWYGKYPDELNNDVYLNGI